MRSGQDRHVRTLNLLTVEILHLVITGHEHPSVFVAKVDDFRVFYVLPELAIMVSKPFMESLYGKTRGPEPGGDGLSCEAFVEK
jgi:hypothetical protein